MIGEKVEKIPLRHKGDKAAASRQPSEIGEGESGVADLSVQLVGFLMGQLEKRGEQGKLWHALKACGVNRISAKVGQEVRMVFQQNDVDAGAGKQKAEHHPRWSTTGDAALGDKLVAVPLV